VSPDAAARPGTPPAQRPDHRRPRAVRPPVDGGRHRRDGGPASTRGAAGRATGAERLARAGLVPATETVLEMDAFQRPASPPADQSDPLSRPVQPSLNRLPFDA